MNISEKHYNTKEGRRLRERLNVMAPVIDKAAELIAERINQGMEHEAAREEAYGHICERLISARMGYALPVDIKRHLPCFVTVFPELSISDFERAARRAKKKSPLGIKDDKRPFVSGWFSALFATHDASSGNRWADGLLYNKRFFNAHGASVVRQVERVSPVLEVRRTAPRSARTAAKSGGDDNGGDDDGGDPPGPSCQVNLSAPRSAQKSLSLKNQSSNSFPLRSDRLGCWRLSGGCSA